MNVSESEELVQLYSVLHAFHVLLLPACLQMRNELRHMTMS